MTHKYVPRYVPSTCCTKCLTLFLQQSQSQTITQQWPKEATSPPPRCLEEVAPLSHRLLYYPQVPGCGVYYEYQRRHQSTEPACGCTATARCGTTAAGPASDSVRPCFTAAGPVCLRLGRLLRLPLSVRFICRDLLWFRLDLVRLVRLAFDSLWVSFYDRILSSFNPLYASSSDATKVGEGALSYLQHSHMDDYQG